MLNSSVSLPVLNYQSESSRCDVDAIRPGENLQDAHGRRVRYLRLSLTSACSMRCLYCRPTTMGHDHDPSRMTPVEIERLVRHLVEQRNVRKVRLTGGEPTSRPDLLEIIRRLSAIRGLEDLAMTTNGLTLARHANDYRRAGLRRVNISLDSLDPNRFERVTGVRGVTRVIEGIDAAQAAGLLPVKINTVVVRDENTADLPELILFAADRGLEIRLIELMPMGPLAPQWAGRFVSQQEMRKSLDSIVRSWWHFSSGSDAARVDLAELRDGRCVRIGFVTAMSCRFCEACDRIRIGADGTIYPCLMDHPAGNLMRALRPEFDAALLDRMLMRSLAEKKREHPATGAGIMTRIGG